jgi:hypothetical protein
MTAKEFLDNKVEGMSTKEKIESIQELIQDAKDCLEDDLFKRNYPTHYASIQTMVETAHSQLSKLRVQYKKELSQGLKELMNNFDNTKKRLLESGFSKKNADYFAGKILEKDLNLS